RDRDDREGQCRRIDQRQGAGLRHVHFLARRRDRAVFDLVAHPTYARAATKVSANISRPITPAIRPVRMLRRARRRSMALESRPRTGAMLCVRNPNGSLIKPVIHRAAAPRRWYVPTQRRSTVLWRASLLEEANAIVANEYASEL